MAEDLDNTIRENAAGPKRASGDSGSVEQHSLSDQIAADMIDIASGGAVFVTGTLAVSWYSRCEVFGYFGVHQDGFLRVYPDGLIHVYKDIHISGRMAGGGRIVMLRREGRILDYDGDSLFALDRAYGYGRTRIT